MKINYGLWISVLLLLLTSGISFGQKVGISNANAADSATVYVSFIVETSGKVTNVRVEKMDCRHCSRGFKERLSSEAVETIRSMPDFKPGKERLKFLQPLKYMQEDE